MIEWLQNVLAGLKIIGSNPFLLAFTIIFIVGSAWLRQRAFKRFLRKQTQTSLEGWDKAAAKTSQPHETGVGTTSALVMKPARNIVKIAFLSLLFWGGGALFFWYGVLPDPEEQTFKNWASFGAMCAFAAASIFLFTLSFTRIEVTKTAITQRRFLRKKRMFMLSSISSVNPAHKNPATGIVLIFTDGRKLRLLASFQGYADMLQTIRNAHPDLPKLILLGQFARRSAQKN